MKSIAMLVLLLGLPIAAHAQGRVSYTPETKCCVNDSFLQYGRDYHR